MRLAKTAKLSWNIAREAGAAFLAYELYPLGMAGSALPPLSPPWLRGPEKKTPILFLHGVLHNPSAFSYLIQKLGFAGYRNLHEMFFFPMIQGAVKMAERTADRVNQLIQQFKVPQVDIIGHSMGGLVARYYVQNLGGDGKVRNLITLGTPHLGTNVSEYFVLKKFKDLSPQSELIRTLREAPLPLLTQGLSISGSLDFCIQPKRHAFWEGVRNIELQGVGHAGLLFSRRVANLIESKLNA